MTISYLSQDPVMVMEMKRGGEGEGEVLGGEVDLVSVVGSEGERCWK